METLNNSAGNGHKESPRLFVRGGRDYSVDTLRSISCFMVVMIHASKCCLQFYNESAGIVPGSATWLGLVAYRGIFVAPTVLFVMISGIFFLTPQREVTAKKVWKKNIPKLAGAYVFWSLVYAVYRIFFQMNPTPEFTIKLLIKEWLVEPPHLWYIPMMLGLYMLVPVLRCITTSENNKSVIEYLMALFLGAIVLYTMSTVTDFPYMSYYENILSKTPAISFLVYPFWMIFGYYLYTYRPVLKTRVKFYIAGVAAVVFYVVVNVWQYVSYGAAYGDQFSSKFVVTTFFKNVAIFLLVTNGLAGAKFEGLVQKVLKKISANTLMIYLCHYLFLYIFFDNNFLFNLGWNPLIVVLIYGILAYIGGLFVADISHLLPNPWKKKKNK